MASPGDTSKGNKLERYKSYLRRLSSSNLLFRSTLLATILLILLLLLHSPRILPLSPATPSSSQHPHRILLSSPSLPLQIRLSASPLRPSGLSVLVTGAAGFIGSHCSLALKLRGDGVVGLDNFNHHLYDPSLKRARHALLARHAILLLEADLNDPLLLPLLFSSHPFSHVLHLAAQAGVRYAAKNPLAYVSANVAALVSLLESAAKRADPPPAVVWASSSSVYGLNRKTPFSESDPTDLPASLYAATKKAGEAIAHSYNHIYGLSLTALRFFTVYGPFGRPDMAYFSFTKSILAGKPVAVFRTPDGRAVARDFTYIDDVVAGCLAALDTAEKSTGAAAGRPKLRTYNLGNTSPVPVAKLVSILEGLLGVKAKTSVVALPTNGDVPFTHANVSLAAADLGYRPTTDLAAGLRKFVKWYTHYYGIKLRPAAAAAAAEAA